MTKATVEKQDEPFGLYFHIPFCTSRCEYCAFSTWTDRAELMGEYVDACLFEMKLAERDGLFFAPSTIFFGGGTPSLLACESIAQLLTYARAESTTEVTIECNPENLTTAYLRSLRDAGVNRISLGVQSLHPHVLACLGRIQHPIAVQRAVECIGDAGMRSYNVDLIYGAVDESDGDWISTVEGVLNFDPPPQHVSAYALGVEAGTPLARNANRHPDEDTCARRYEIVDEILFEHGYQWYEISNWAQPGFECAHNASCWRQENYLGIGCAAHSHRDGQRWVNTTAIDRYLARLRLGHSPIASRTTLSPIERELEGLELALRTRSGVPRTALTLDGEIDDLVEHVGDHYRLTRRGRLLANEVAIRLHPIGRNVHDDEMSSKHRQEMRAVAQ